MIPDIYSIFVLNNYQWKFDGEKKVPTEEDLRSVIEHAKKVLVESDMDQIEIDHLIVQKENDSFHVFVHVGTEQ